MMPDWVDALKKQWPTIQEEDQAKDLTLRVALEDLESVLAFLKSNEDTRMDFLRMIAAVDFPEHFELVYQLFSYPLRHSVAVKTHVSKENGVAPSVVTLWPAANWHEREAFDLMGVQFEGHPNLTRLLLPDDWQGHPLQKTYEEQDEYRGVSTTRTYATKLPSFTDPLTEEKA
jgi:NADH-quinone oxidoreductase subunit C